MSSLQFLRLARRLRATSAAPCLLMVASGAIAQTAPTAPRSFVEERRQQDCEGALREQQERNVDQRLPAQTKSEDKRLPTDEAPCFRIDRLPFTGEASEQCQWALSAANGPQGDDTPIGLQGGQCQTGRERPGGEVQPEDGATGRLQAGATVAWDNPLSLNDLLYVSLNHDAFNHPGAGTNGQTVHYSVPYGDWLLGATASQGKYRQSVQGLSQHYVYAGETSNAEVRLSRLLYRDASRKTTASVRAFRRASSNSVDDTEIDVQRRVVGGWEASLNHKEFIGAATLEGTLTYRRGTHAFGALAAPEDAFGEGTSYFHLTTAEVNANVPFTLGGQKLRYGGLWRAQWNGTQLTPQDRFAIGGRYTVRGFDGESSLLGDRGWLLRNDLGWALGQTGAELYLGLDYGHVGGRSTAQGLGNHLAGGVVGVRGALPGALKGLNYDLFVGAPISKPEGYRTAKVTGGFNLNFSF